MASSAVGESVVQFWEKQQQSIAFVLLDPSWWGYILGCFLSGSSLYTLKQVCKAWRDLTASPYYTNYSPLRVTTKLLGRLNSSGSSPAVPPTEQRLRILKQISLQCGGRICLGLPRTAVEFHETVIELLTVTSPVQQITVSLDTSYTPVVGALHGLLLRSSETLVDLKLRGARIAQQLCAMLQESHKHSAVRFSDTVGAVGIENTNGASRSAYYSRRPLLLLPQLRILETDNVYLLRDVHAPRLISLFVDYNSVPLQRTPQCVPSSDGWSHTRNDVSSSGPLSPAATGNTVTAVCRWFSAESDDFPRLVLLEFLARSGACLQRLTQAAILPLWSYPHVHETLPQGAETRTLLQMGVSLPILKDLNLSDVGLLVHLHTVNLSMLTLELPQVAVLPVLFQHQRHQQLAGQLQELVLRLSPYKPTITVSQLTEDLSHSATCALSNRIHGRLHSSPFPSSSYEAIGSSLQHRSRRTRGYAQKTGETGQDQDLFAAAFEALCGEHGGSAVTKGCSHEKEARMFFSSASQYAEQSPAGQHQQQTTARCFTTAAVEQSNAHPQQWWAKQLVKTDAATPGDEYLDATTRPDELRIISDGTTLRTKVKVATNNATVKHTAAVPFRRHRTWTASENTLNTGVCSPDVNQGYNGFENVLLRHEVWGDATCSSGPAGTANAGGAASANSPPISSPVVVLLNLTHLTAPWSLLGLLVCPNLRQLHVTGMVQRVHVLNFLQAAAPGTECLLIDKAHIDFKVENGSLAEAQERAVVAGGRKTTDVFGSGENALIWRLLQLKKYKGPAALLSDDVDCPNLEYLEVTDEDATGELSRFLFAAARTCPRLKRLSLRSLCVGAVGATQMPGGTRCHSSHCRAAAFSGRRITIQGEVVLRKAAAAGASCPLSSVTSRPHYATPCVVAQPADPGEVSVTCDRGRFLETALPTVRHISSTNPLTSRVRRSWFDDPFISAVDLSSLIPLKTGRCLGDHGPACIYAAAGAVFSSTAVSVAAARCSANSSQSTSSSRQYGLEELHLSRLNARQVVDWLAVAPPVARLILTQVKKLYVDHLEEGRKAMARLLAALPMLEYVEIQRSAGMTEKFLYACFAFRGFHPCRKQLPLHRSANSGKQAAQWCFVRHEDRCTGEARRQHICDPVTKQVFVPPARRSWLPTSMFREGEAQEDNGFV